MADKGYKNITITNRTKEKAEALATELNFEVADYQLVSQNILEADIVISSVHREEPLITKATLQNKSASIKYLIDLSVPNSIEADIEEVSGVVLYNLDEIQCRANAALQRRMEAIPQPDRAAWIDSFCSSTGESRCLRRNQAALPHSHCNLPGILG